MKRERKKNRMGVSVTDSRIHDSKFKQHFLSNQTELTKIMLCLGAKRLKLD